MVNGIQIDYEAEPREDLIEFDDSSESDGLLTYGFLPDEVVKNRAKRYKDALNNDAVDEESLFDLIDSGNEESFRNQIVLQRQDDSYNFTSGVLASMASEGNFDPVTMDVLSREFPLENQKTILEEMFGHKHATTAAMKAYTDTRPIEVEEFKKVDTHTKLAQDYISKRVYVHKLIEEQKAQKAINVGLKGPFPSVQQVASNFYDAAIEEIQPFIPFFTWQNIARSGIDLPEIEGISSALNYLPGELFKHKIDYLHSLPIKDFEKQLERAIAEISKRNVNDAIFFLELVNEYTTLRRVVEDGFGVLDLFILPALARGTVKWVAKRFKGLSSKADDFARREIIKKETDILATSGSETRKFTPTEDGRVVESAPNVRPEKGVPQNDGESALMNYERMVDWQEAMEKEGESWSKIIERDLPTVRTQDDWEDAQKALKTRLTKEQRDPFPKREPEIEEVPATVVDRVKHTLVNTIDSLRGGRIREDAIRTARGDVEGAASLRAREDLLNMAIEAQQGKSFADLLYEAATIFDPSRSVFGGRASYKLANNLARETQAHLNRNADQLMKYLKTAPQNAISRGEGEFLEAAIDAEVRRVKTEFPQINNRILDGGPSHIPAEKTPANVDLLEFKIGNDQSKLFESAEQANVVGRDFYKLKDYTIRPEGNRYYISMVKPIDETAPDASALRLETNGKTPVGLFRAWAAILSSPENFLASKHRLDRLTATYGGSELLALQVDIAKSIGRVRNKERFKEFINYQRSWEHPETREIGRFSSTQRGFEQEWFYKFKEYPNQRETEAYWAYRQLSDFDWVIRNLSIYKDKTRQGIKHYEARFNLRDDVDGLPTVIDLKGIEGKKVDDIPWNNTEDTDILIIDFQTGKGDLIPKSRSNARPMVQAYKDEGYDIIQLTNFGDQALRKQHPDLDKVMGDAAPAFVLIKNTNERELPFKQIPHRAGFHVEYPDGAFVRMPIMRTLRDGSTRYDGDINFLRFDSLAEADRWAAKMDEARLLLRDVNDPNLDPALRKQAGQRYQDYVKTNLPWTPKAFRDLIPDASVPFKATMNGENTMTRFGEEFKGRFSNLKDSTTSSYNLYNTTNLRFAQSRDHRLQTIVQKGTADSPHFHVEGAEMVDPYDTLRKSASKLTENVYLDDLKINVAEDFVRQFGRFLDGDINQHLADPFGALFDAPFKSFTKVSFDDQGALKQAKNVRRATKDFIGLQTDLDKQIGYFRQRLADSIEGRVKNGRFEGTKAADLLIDNVRLGSTKDPSKFLRAIGYHAKLGLFNPFQFALQSQSFVNVATIAGAEAAAASAPAYWYSRMRMGFRDNDTFLNDFGGRMEKFGWKKEHYIESHKALRESGLMRVGGEISFVDDVMNPKLIQTKFGKFLDAGTFPFKEGERLSRITGWHAAYYNWRKANPNAVFNRKARQQVLQEADLMTVNMSRASNAMWQKGLLSVSTQFFSYQIRLAEQIFGKRLDRHQFARGLLLYSAMYGVPTAVGVGTGVVPWPEIYRQHLIKNNIDPDDTILRSLFLRGIPSLLTEFITGSHFGIGERLGPGGLTFFNEALNGEREWWEILGGLPGTLVGNWLKLTEPLFYSMISVLDEDGYGGLSMDDLWDAFTPVSSFNNARRGWTALNEGKIISKNENDFGEVNTFESLWLALTGMTPQRTGDTFLRIKSLKEIREMKKEASKDIVREYRRAVKAGNEGDYDKQNKHMNRVHWLFTRHGFTPDQKADVLRAAAKNRDISETIQRQWLKEHSYSPEAQEVFR